MKDKMLRFMVQQIFCTISTVTQESKPEAAFVGFSSNENLEIIIGTSNKTRKYQNIIKNNNVAIVIADTSAEVQYEGMAREVKDEEYRNLIEKQHIGKLPGAAKYRDDPDQVYFIISPTWIHFISHGIPDEMEEFTEFAK